MAFQPRNPEEEKSPLNVTDEVLPLIIPNNCTYDMRTKTMTRDTTRERTSLQVFEPALKFIENIQKKISVIAICGRARTGKSLVAGELMSPQAQPCPFDLGHSMDACTYGIWVGLKPVKHPKHDDTVILVIDVEGTGFHEASQHNDMQLMVLSLLMSSTFIYNSLSVFDSTALDEIQFILQLSEKIHCREGDDRGMDFSKIFPNFMWLLRDAFLRPEIDGRVVSPTEYFTKKVLKAENGFNMAIMQRQAIRQLFMAMFPKYGAFTLPAPHSDSEKLTALGNLDRTELNPAFNRGLEEFCKQITNEAPIKTLFQHTQVGDKFIQCTGAHLAHWIRAMVEAVNDPNQVPQISSMSEAVMITMYRKSKQRGVARYKDFMQTGLANQRNNDPTMPLDVVVITQLHNKAVDYVIRNEAADLCTKFGNADQLSPEQSTLLKEFHEEIGHSADGDINKIGKTGVLKDIFADNITLSQNFCEGWIAEVFPKKVGFMFDRPGDYECSAVIKSFDAFQKEYLKCGKGPMKHRAWDTFVQRVWRSKLSTFKQLRGFNQRAVVAAQKAAQAEAQRKQAEDAQKQQKAQMVAQRNALQSEAKRQNDQMTALKAQMAEQTKKTEEQIANMQKSGFKEMSTMMQDVMKADRESRQEQMAMMRQTIEAIKNQEPPVVHVHHPKPSSCFGAYHNTIDIRRMGQWMTVTMNDLMVGDDVLTLDSDNNAYQWTPVFYVVRHNKAVSMIQLFYQTEQSDAMDQISSFITVTGAHLLYRKNSGGERELVTTDEIKVGDSLFIANGIDYKCIDDDTNALIECQMALVTNIKSFSDNAISPITFSGNMVVSGVDASCFSHSEHNHNTLHRIGAPFRELYRILPISISSAVINVSYGVFKYSRQLSLDYIWDYRGANYVYLFVAIALVLFALYFAVLLPVFGVSRICYS